MKELFQSIASDEPPIPDHFIALSTTAAWEFLVQKFARRIKPREPSSLKAEQAAQRALAKIVRKRLEHRRAGSRPEIAPGVPAKTLLSPRLAGIVSLNFTVEPFQGLLSAVKINAKGKGERSRRVRGTSSLEIFYPHGDLESPDSLALGLRQHALRLERWEFLRRKFHAAERESHARRALLAFGARTTFVHHALTSPMIFAGCGLREVESTLWWLLATRARNCATSVALPQPLAYFLTADPVPSSLRAKLEFTRCRVLDFSRHTDVWTFLVNVIDSLPESPREEQDSTNARAHKARASGWMNPSALWAAVRAAGLDRFSHDLSHLPDDAREVALSAALRIAVSPSGRSASRKAPARNLHASGSQLVVVHVGKNAAYVIEEVRAASLDDAARGLELALEVEKRRRARVREDYGLVLVLSKTILSAVRSRPNHELVALIQDALVTRHVPVIAPHQLRHFLENQRKSPLHQRCYGVKRRLEAFVSRNSPRVAMGQAVRRTLRAYLDELGWNDIAFDLERPVPDAVWREISQRLDDVSAKPDTQSPPTHELELTSARVMRSMRPRP